MRILKFGGSSVASPQNIMKVAGIVKGSLEKYGALTVVVSARAGVTNQLSGICDLIADHDHSFDQVIRDIEIKHLTAVRELIPVASQPEILAEIMSLCNQLQDIVKGASLVGEVTPRTRDLILSFGEQLSAFLLSRVLKMMIADANYTDARMLVVTDSDFGKAKVDFSSTNIRIKQYFENNRGTNIVTGFIGRNERGDTTTLGRNGSDFTASILAAALDAEMIEIWSDTDGVLTADPSYVSEAFNISRLSYNEAMELSHFGAKVIFPASLIPAMAKKIPILVKNTFNSEHKGTLVCHEPLKNGSFVRGITSLNRISLVSVEGCGMVGVAGVAARMFTALSASGISVILISQASSEHSICICIPESEADRAVSVLSTTFGAELTAGLISSVSADRNLAIVAVVGENMRYTPGVAAKIFEPLGSNGINIKAISQGSSELNISFVINEKDLRAALVALHNSMFFHK